MQTPPSKAPRNSRNQTLNLSAGKELWCVNLLETDAMMKEEKTRLTVDDDGGRGAPPLGHDVLGHAGVVGCVGQTCLLDDEVVVDGDVEVPVLRRVDDLLVLPPLHLPGETKEGVEKTEVSAEV